ncbi:MAG TPA: valine--tRNA ligase [Anaerolineae bacterium]|nr:valine--tRNA ligase [Anaerolineae bacterium]HQH37276.1 valine--tRNA ligase [Anaerolineae bacterium]
MAALPKRYDPQTEEPRLQVFWQTQGIYHFDVNDDTRPVYSIDTPPPTVSGHLHLGHVYSYSHPDFVARFWRMNGYNVFYPMGYDDNGLPTERLVEKWEGIRAVEVGREAFIERCLAVSEQAERDYQALWQRLGLSIDWRYTYRTIDAESRRISQLSFLDLYRKGLAYRKEAPAIWCPECQTAIAQAELNDLDRESTFYTLAFALEDGGVLEIATTRTELLPACVAIFVHPDDARFAALVGKQARVPYFEQWVPILTDPGADPAKGTGAVMCCTFGDTTDVAWWYMHHLPLRVALDRAGRMTDLAGDFAGLPSREARRRIVAALAERGLLLGERPTAQSVRVHERCDTPVEYIVTPQWFVRVLDSKDELLASGAQVHWHPDLMETRFREWVENLNWDWCISRQRYYGVTFPVWYCDVCGAIILADEDELPVDPTTRAPSHPCACGSTSFTPETDVMDTWATSSLSPQIVGQWLANPALYAKVYPFSLRPQAHEIIRTWAFYTIVKSHHHFGATPWTNAAISGWGLAPEGAGKISKSRGGGPMPPLEMLEQYSADAVRYWASSTGFGKDALISEEKIQLGTKLITKLWNVARFAERFLPPPTSPPLTGTETANVIVDQPHATFLPSGGIEGRLTPADRWILARLQKLIRRVTALFQGYDYAAAKSETEAFFWRDLADNYLEMAKLRLYDEDADAAFTLDYVLRATLKLFAPFLPHVTEVIYQALFAGRDGAASIHRARWPEVEAHFEDADAEAFGEMLVEIATAVRRYKSERGLSLGAEIGPLYLATKNAALAEQCRTAAQDLASVTRTQRVEVVAALDGEGIVLLDGEIQTALK